jgi:double-strand break repair protein AddB
MFPEPPPRLFALAPGADLAAAVAEGLAARCPEPAAMAAATVILPTARMRRAVRQALATGGARLLPRLWLVSEIAEHLPGGPLPPETPAIRRRLELAALVGRLAAADPEGVPAAAVLPLAQSLDALFEEMHSEGVAPAALAGLDVAGHAAHWQRARDLLAIAAPVFAGAAGDGPGARQARAVRELAAAWAARPPAAPVLLAGSTGSRGTTLRLMQAVAALPQGAVLLPGFDTDLPAAVWEGLGDALAAEDHPQFRNRRILVALGATAAAVRPWPAGAAPDPARNRLLSLALRPAPLTDQWRHEGPGLGDLVAATQGLTLIEAPGPRAEAAAVAVIMRAAVAAGRAVALVTADRSLGRQVTAALDRWNIRPDDSAGQPLALSPPGRLLRHLAEALAAPRIGPEMLLVLLKHPLAARGAARGPHLLLTRELELSLRRDGPPFPAPADLAAWAGRRPDAGAREWAAWVGGLLERLARAPAALAARLAALRGAAEYLVAGPAGGGAAELWAGDAGDTLAAALAALEAAAALPAVPQTLDLAAVLASALADHSLRDDVEAHPLALIRGPREVRVREAGLVILAGLNEGSWPAAPAPDPWLNRQMRRDAGLTLPDRRIGLAAHDFQMAAAAPEVVLSRALRDDAAPTVAARWLNRLVNLLSGLAATRGPEALAAMRARGAGWLALAARAETPAATVPPARRPAPRPPVAARPRELAVTEIRTLVRDPYAVYARSVLGLRPLPPLRQEPDARLRGQILHKLFERFAGNRPAGETVEAAAARLRRLAQDLLAAELPWPLARRLLLARIDAAALPLARLEARLGGAPVLIERRGRIGIGTTGVTLVGRPDRIDRLPDGRLRIIDYKSGRPPTPEQQRAFDKQLFLLAAMAERGAFPALGTPVAIAEAVYIGLGTGLPVATVRTDPATLAAVWDELARLVAAYGRREQGYAARRAMERDDEVGDFDHLARLGEWGPTDAAWPEAVG